MVEATGDQVLPGLIQLLTVETDALPLLTAEIAQGLPALTQDVTAFLAVADAEIAQTLLTLQQRAAGAVFRTGGGVEGFEVGYGPMGQGINRRRKDFAVGKGRAVS
jgi:hypothetical protein